MSRIISSRGARDHSRRAATLWDLGNVNVSKMDLLRSLSYRFLAPAGRFAFLITRPDLSSPPMLPTLKAVACPLLNPPNACIPAPPKGLAAGWPAPKAAPGCCVCWNGFGAVENWLGWLKPNAAGCGATGCGC